MQAVIIWIISFLAICGVIIRPFKTPEYIWAAGGAVILVIFGLLSATEAFAGIANGLDVYLFLTGMMLLAETAREEGVFDWLAAHATQAAGGSGRKLFVLIYLVGTVVTIFLSNDATAVVLTPAVAAAVRAAKIKYPLPYVLICAFIANAASFVLPISNPANLVIYGSHMPSLLQWLGHYTIPSLVSISVTYAALYFTQRNTVKQVLERNIAIPQLSAGGKAAIAGVLATTIVLLIASAYRVPLGLVTAITGVFTSAVVVIRVRKSPLKVIKGVSWSVIPLVAGLFVIAQGFTKTGLTQALIAVMHQNAQHDITQTAWLGGVMTAICSNLVNNLPVGLIAGNVLQLGHAPAAISSAVLVGVDLGPNLSITGSLATILWLVALRREGLDVSAWTFLTLGALIMTTALTATLAVIWL